MLEKILIQYPYGLVSRLRLCLFRVMGMAQGQRNRMEGGGRVRRCNQIQIGSNNAFTQGTWLWPLDSDYSGRRICIGDNNYFNRNVMLDACGLIEIGNDNMVGPDVYITDSNHRFGPGLDPHTLPMDVGHVKVGNRCWIGAKAVILKNVELGDYCVVAAGAVVTKSFPAGSVIAGVPARLMSAQPKA